MEGVEDPFMVLPECLLHTIISLLSFKEAARTSVLSKHWLNHWRATANIELDESFFVKLGELNSTKVVKRRDFIDFVRRWIGNYREPCIDKFIFAFSKPEQFAADIENFIVFAIAKNAKTLSLDLSDPTWVEDDPENHKPIFDLPSDVYGHEVLESLKLFSCKIDMPACKNFSLLKDLSLGWIEVEEKSMKTLLQHCPLLESLSLTKCWNIGPFFLSEPGLLLEKLAIDKCSFHEPLCISNYIPPSLNFLKYSGSVGSLDFDYLCCLEEADLDFGQESNFLSAAGDILYNLLVDLFSVTLLTVCSYMLQVIPHSEQIYGTEFPLNVRHLILKTALHSHEFYGITFFLNSCPFLRTLSIELCPARVFPDYEPPLELNPSDFWTKDSIVYSCIRTTLKVVEVKGFKGTMNEFLVLQYLISFGHVMEQMNLYISREIDDNGGNLELYRARAQQLLQLKKNSKMLKISIY